MDSGRDTKDTVKELLKSEKELEKEKLVTEKLRGEVDQQHLLLDDLTT